MRKEEPSLNKERQGNATADMEAAQAAWRHKDRLRIFVKAARERRRAYALLLRMIQFMMLTIDMEAARCVELQERMGDC